MYISKYIHRNPLSVLPYEESPRRLQEYPYSSYKNYLKRYTQSWLKPDPILAYFSKTHKELSYEEFVEQERPDDLQPIGDQIIDLE